MTSDVVLSVAYMCEDHQVKTLIFAKGYLNACGCLKDDQDDDVESGIKKFQELYRLNVSGKLDLATIKAIKLPSCGVPDLITCLVQKAFSMIQSMPSSKEILHDLLLGEASLTDSTLATTFVPIDDLRQAFLQALGGWTQVTNSKFTFTEVVTGKSDIAIGFYSRDQGVNSPFDGRGGVYALAAAPTEGRMHLDADESWSVAIPTPADGVDLVSMALHEAGHLLGLEHGQDPNAVMYAFLGIGENKRILGPDDIAGIQARCPN
ncbi:metalloendoproteinase 5-MMP-like [Prosopis cineraria]|uniref:metalloendoproteinase 5-MMP-like n=1 Tax=Prosopis cineraria TaxID=364024 RepID=UPI00240F8B34|nr:metalloendoproteinase 5-MMP-like [Prosopis cineraria]